jgi:hypothetical protein
MFKISDNEIHKMSAAMAGDLVRQMVARESRSAGDTEGAMSRLEAKYGIGFWQLAHLRGGRAKTIETGLFMRIRAAYLDHCQRQISALQHEIALERARGADDDLVNLEAEAAVLARKIAAKKGEVR